VDLGSYPPSLSSDRSVTQTLTYFDSIRVIVKESTAAYGAQHRVYVVINDVVRADRRQRLPLKCRINAPLQLDHVVVNQQVLALRQFTPHARVEDAHANVLLDRDDLRTSPIQRMVF